MRELLFQTKALLKREIALEKKQKHVFNGLLLYIISTVFVCYLSFKQIVNVPTWNALFWIIILFASVNATSRGMSNFRRGRLLYEYTLASAKAVILSRIIYQTLLIWVISLLGYAVYGILIGDLVQDHLFFLLALLLGSAGLSGTLSLITAIAAKSDQYSTLTAILSFPVILPMLIVLMRFSKNAVDGLDHSVQYPYLIALIAINFIVWTLSLILFPFLWRD
jgi:heme exporter protein B